MNGVLSAEELEDKLLSLQIECRDCPDSALFGFAACEECPQLGEIRRLDGKLEKIRAEASERKARKSRDRRQSKPNVAIARGMAR